MTALEQTKVVLPVILPETLLEKMLGEIFEKNEIVLKEAFINVPSQEDLNFVLSTFDEDDKRFFAQCKNYLQEREEYEKLVSFQKLVIQKGRYAFRDIPEEADFFEFDLFNRVFPNRCLQEYVSKIKLADNEKMKKYALNMAKFKYRDNENVHNVLVILEKYIDRIELLEDDEFLKKGFISLFSNDKLRIHAEKLEMKLQNSKKVYICLGI